MAISVAFAEKGVVDESILSKLLSPGPLAIYHKSIEQNGCLKCHDPGKGISDNKCLVCHTEIKKYKKNKKGFHGSTNKKCIECHSDHKGRNYYSTEVNKENFNHNQTGYILKGQHKNLKCLDCHTRTREKKLLKKSDTRYFGEKNNCINCHKKDDIHFFQGEYASKSCEMCHNQDSWKKVTNFSHKKFNLLGNHQKLSCTKCHAPNGLESAKYSWPDLAEKKCMSCHGSAHTGGQGMGVNDKECTKCHNQKSFKIENFNHGLITGLELRGKHAKIDCTQCHIQTKDTLKIGKKDYKWRGLERDCLTCHKDYHLFGNQLMGKNKSLRNCKICHFEENFKETTFNHNIQTMFPLRGQHQKLKCNDCHKVNKNNSSNRIYQWPELKEKSCQTCHKNPHLNSPNKIYTDKKCSGCHNPTSWKMANLETKDFDHNRDTRFELTGKHKKVTCDKCHEVNGQQKYIFDNGEKGFCISCHPNIHRKQFSNKFRDSSCLLCHTTENFTKRKTFDHDRTDYKLLYKHNFTACEKCHIETKNTIPGTNKKRRKFLFPEIKRKNCNACHKDPHKGSYGKLCSNCHNERSFKATRDYHKEFRLTGAHHILECSECHINGRRLGGMSDNCLLCHQKDDIHKGSLPDCSECHGQNFWEVPNFKHSLSGFPIIGSHRALSCGDCHKRGIYRGTPDQCIDCHLKDAQKVTLPVHSLPAFQDCEDCHNQFNF